MSFDSKSCLSQRRNFLLVAFVALLVVCVLFSLMILIASHFYSDVSSSSSIHHRSATCHEEWRKDRDPMLIHPQSISTPSITSSSQKKLVYFTNTHFVNSVPENKRLSEVPTDGKATNGVGGASGKHSRVPITIEDLAVEFLSHVQHNLREDEDAFLQQLLEKGKHHPANQAHVKLDNPLQSFVENDEGGVKERERIDGGIRDTFSSVLRAFVSVQATLHEASQILAQYHQEQEVQARIETAAGARDGNHSKVKGATSTNNIVKEEQTKKKQETKSTSKKPSISEVIPIWGCLCTNIDFPLMLNLLSHLDVAIEKYVFTVNGPGLLPRIFIAALQISFGSERIVAYFNDENEGVAAAWNNIMREGFHMKKIGGNFEELLSPTAVPYVVISNSDVIPFPSLLRLFAQDSYRKADEIVLNRFAHFALFAMTRFGRRELGFFDEVLYPAYMEDVEFHLRAVSKGLGGSKHFPLSGSNQVDQVFWHVSGPNKKYVKHFAEIHGGSRYILAKWGVGLHGVSDFAKTKPFPYPFKNPAIRHNHSWIIDENQRHCIKRAHTPCFYEMEEQVRKLEDPNLRKQVLEEEKRKRVEEYKRRVKEAEGMGMLIEEESKKSQAREAQIDEEHGLGNSSVSSKNANLTNTTAKKNMREEYRKRLSEAEELKKAIEEGEKHEKDIAHFEAAQKEEQKHQSGVGFLPPRQLKKEKEEEGIRPKGFRIRKKGG